jgi:hypothetical protein
MNMGMAAMEAAEKNERMIQNDIDAGHQPGCLISYPPPGGGYCDCGKFERGVSQYDLLAPATEGPIVNQDHPFYHFCRKCLNLGKVMLVAFIVEVAMFYPTHLLFHELGWL